jgi:hypothetical protein
MARPKGSKNKPPEPVQQPEYTDYTPYNPNNEAREIMADVKAGEKVAKPDHVTMTLTDEDLAPARDAKARHERATSKYQKQEIASELRRKEIGEIEELSVPQVLPFDMSAAFTKVAQKKAREAGYRFALNLRKTAEGWVFEASNVVKVKNAPQADQL